MKAPYNYGLSQEDALTELEALAIQPDDRLLCIASAGEIPLNLLALRPIRIEAVDVSLNQLFLCRLKHRACLALEPDEAAAFLGFMEARAEKRRKFFDHLSSYLSEEEKRFWAENMTAIEYGPIAAGRFERYLEKVRSAGLCLISKRKLIRLFELEAVADRQDYFDRFLNTGFLRMIFKVAFHPRVYRKRGIAEEGLIHSGARDSAEFFYNRFRSFCTVCPPRQNYYLQWIFFGRVLFPEARPEYLTEKGLQKVRERSAGLSWQVESFQDRLRSCAPGDFNKFHLSNIGDWMTRDQFAEVLALVGDKALPGSKACFRYIHLNHPVPERLRGRLNRDDERGEELMERDRFPFYSLVIMEIK